ncbi:uncharacterized protein LOC113143472 isoform X5 [Mastacembelus armatus]|uniref:uncharacterized protein LOC113143472 isoform X5 n=1 Tax=Mastacembelus armatus TaxID=205130 RepID=UPI000E457F3B|nr:uncharacterized protein LOC113143472 isoform X5 [Mastacembelus armatus]XP_026184903.1 uncharacterized protein LOC113143472 isoform X5 [Mastacembelus armatus]XP_026184904.1 uncharacterized protein LOC113143472 isoform X5 [Mastacembelus armatus]
MDGIDESYIWQRRIHHGIRYQKVTVPFPESVEIGLEFNAALERKEKLDLCLLTNAVMLELCDFAKTVTKSEKYFLFEMLEFNFDLGVDLDSDKQCYEYAIRVYNKIKQIKEQIKLKPRRWSETFSLPDLNIISASTVSEVSGRYYPKRNKIADSSVLTDGNKTNLSSEMQKKSNGASNGALVIKRRGRVQLKLTDEVYPFCRDLGVTLAVRPNETPKQKLDPSLINNGVMMELLDFSRVLCGSHTQIVNELVKQNFGHELDKLQFRMQFHKLMERKYSCLTAEDRDAFRKETFKLRTEKREQKCKKRKNIDTDYKELEKVEKTSKRRVTLRNRDSFAQDISPGSDMSYMCPVDFETEIQPSTKVGVGPEKMTCESSSGTAGETQSAVSLDVKREEKVFTHPPQRQSNGDNPNLSKFHPKDTTFREISNLFSADKNEDINGKTLKQKIWMRRAPRSKQILKSSRVNDMFAHSREIGLDFNVGSGNKQILDQQLLTNWVLWEVFKFATAMTKSLRSFLCEILGNNFKLVLEDRLHQRNFIFYMITKEKNLQNHPARQTEEFLSNPFQFPEVYNMVDVTSETEQELKTEQQKNCDSSGLSENQQTEMEPYPFCQKLGVNLWSTEERPANQKLDLNVLTTGAVLEIFSFVRDLCGSVQEKVNDILEHNFDLELQSGSTKAAQVIQRWYTTQKIMMKNQNMSPKINRWLNMGVPLNGHSQPGLQSPTSNVLEHLVSDKMKIGREQKTFSENVQQEKKVNSYHICKEIGLELDLSSKSEAKTKLDLQVLTRGVLFEVHHYVEQNCNRYVPGLYEILEYNFDLSSQSHRKVEFAWSIASQVIAMVKKNGRSGNYLSKVFELPLEVSESSQVVCKQEPEDGFSESDLDDSDDIMFVRKLKPVDIEVEIE